MRFSNQAPGVWYYRVRAENGAKTASKAARSVGVTPTAPALAPIDNPAQADEYTLAWSAVDGADGYMLQESGTLTFTLPVTRYLVPRYPIGSRAAGWGVALPRAGVQHGRLRSHQPRCRPPAVLTPTLGVRSWRRWNGRTRISRTGRIR